MRCLVTSLIFQRGEIELQKNNFTHAVEKILFFCKSRFIIKLPFQQHYENITAEAVEKVKLSSHEESEENCAQKGGNHLICLTAFFFRFKEESLHEKLEITKIGNRS